MPNRRPFLFTESNFGALPDAAPQASPADPIRSAGPTTPAPSFVETLGFPKGTSEALLALVLENTMATPQGTRLDHLRSPGVLCRLFSQSAADASYALAILSIVESPGFESTLARLKAADAPSATSTPAQP